LPFLTRRRFLQAAAGTAAAGALVLAEDAIILEPNRPILTALEVPLVRLPAAFDGFTIAQLSDFHYDRLSDGPLRAAIEVVNRLHPDVVVLTGDFVTLPMFYVEFHSAKLAASAAEPCASLLSQLRPRLGIFSILGNHDLDSDAPRITATLQAHGMPVLRNRSIPLEQGGSRIWLCGMDSVMEHRQDINQALRGVPSQELVILLVHEPDFADRAALHPVDLQLSGHSHGGQVWVPGLGAPWLPRLARKYPRGLHRIGPLTLYTNMGLGTIRLPIRLNCPPEVTLFTLRAADRALQPRT
jgi:predicted MPP superfamily phosphohydrolase